MAKIRLFLLSVKKKRKRNEKKRKKARKGTPFSRFFSCFCIPRFVFHAFQGEITFKSRHGAHDISRTLHEIFHPYSACHFVLEDDD